MSDRPVVLALNVGEFVISMRDAASSAGDFLEALNHEDDE